MQKKIYNLVLVYSDRKTSRVSSQGSWNDLKEHRHAEMSRLLRDSVTGLTDEKFDGCWQCRPEDLPEIAGTLRPGKEGHPVWKYSDPDGTEIEATLTATMLDIDIFRDTGTVGAALIDLFVKNRVRKIVCGLHENSRAAAGYAPAVISYDDDDNALYRDLGTIELEQEAGSTWLSLETAGHTPAGYISRDGWDWFAAPFCIETLYSYCEALIGDGELTEDEKNETNR